MNAEQHLSYGTHVSMNDPGIDSMGKMANLGSPKAFSKQKPSIKGSSLMDKFEKKQAKGAFSDSESDDNNMSTREKTHEKNGEIAPK